MTNQRKISVSFKETDLDIDMYVWLTEKAKVIGYSNAVKQILYEAKQREELQEGK